MKHLTCQRIAFAALLCCMIYAGLRHERETVSEHSPPLYITMVTNISGGRLGNNMYQYAALRAAGRRYPDRRVAVRPDMIRRLSDVFQLQIPTRVDLDYSTFTELRDIQENVPKSLALLDNLAENRNVTLSGQFQSFRFFTSVANELRRKDFIFKKSVKDLAEKFLNGIPAADVRVGIHIRRTDHLRRQYIRQGFYFPDTSYFARALDYFAGNVTTAAATVQFIVASDDISWCRDFFAETFPDYNVEYSENNSPGVDLAILSLCDHVILTLGTFGWWAGWLNAGVAVYMKEFPRSGTWTARTYRPGYYIPPDGQYNTWVGL